MEENIKEYLNINAPKYAEFKGYDESFINEVKDFTEGASPTDLVQLFYDEAISKLKEGGLIPKFQNPSNTLPQGIPEWYLKLYKQKELLGWTPELDASLAGENLNKNKLHHQYKDLTGAYNANQAYTSNKDIIGQDLNSFYNSDYKDKSLADFITEYNNNAGIIRSRWDRENITYGENDAKEHNLLYKRMFANRSGSTENPYDLGYSPSTEEIQGSTTWMRRMDRYEKEFENLTDEEKKSRIHKIGNLGYVYKKANGDIAELDADTAKRLGLTLEQKTNPEVESKTPPVQTKSDLQAAVPNVGTDGLKGNKIYDGILKAAPHVIEAFKFLDAFRTNKRMHENFLKDYAWAPEEYTPKHRNIYGDLGALNRGIIEAANIRSQAARLGNGTVDYRTASSINLEGNKNANQVTEETNKQYNDLARNTSEQSLAQEFDNIDKQQAAANENLGRFTAYRNVLLNNRNEYLNQLFMNRTALLNYLAETAMYKNQDNKESRAEVLQAQMQARMNNDKTLNQLELDYRTNPTEANYNAYYEYKVKLSKILNQKYQEELARLRGIRFKDSPFDSVQVAKDGGKVSDDGPVKRRRHDLERRRKERKDKNYWNDKSLERLGRLTYLWAKRAQGK